MGGDEGGVLGEWMQTGLLAANLTWTTLCLGGYRAETMVVTSVLTSLLLVTWLATEATGPRGFRRLHPASAWPALFLAYAAANAAFVSPMAWLGWREWLGWANMAAVFWVVLNGIRGPRTRRVLFLTLVVLGLAAVTLGCYQRFTQPDWLPMGRHQVEQFRGRASGPFGIPNSLAALLVLLLPVTGALALRRRATAIERVAWGWISSALFLGLVLTLSRGAGIALALALVAWPLCIRNRWTRKRRWGVTALVFGGVLCIGALTVALSPRARERVGRLVRDAGERSRPILWRAAWELFRAHPILGSGAGSYNILFEQHRPKDFVDEPQWAHNEYLNTLSDYGAVGLVLFLGGGIVVVLRHRRRVQPPEAAAEDGFQSRVVASAMEVGIAAFALQLVVDFNLRIPALAMACAMMSALVLSRDRPVEESPRSGRSTRWPRATAWLAAALVLAAMIPVSRIYRAEALRARARQAMESAVATSGGGEIAPFLTAESDLRRSLALHAGNGDAWADLAFALELEGIATPARMPELGIGAEAAARRALERSATVPEFWIRRGVALDMQGNFPDAGAAFARALELAPANANAWYYYAYHLSLDTKGREEALRAIAKCLSLDAGNRAAEALKVKLNGRP